VGTTHGDKPFRAIEDGQVFTADGIELHAIATPGHSPARPACTRRAGRGVLRRHALPGRAGATGRSFSDFPTILGSIKDKLGKLPPDTVVYTGHGDTTRIGDEIVNYDEWVARGH
jgi:glyoxylase-like metal-dependent hydrolase (beta-lactamase superfamily II)